MVGLPPDLSDGERRSLAEQPLDFDGTKYKLELLEVKEETPPVLEVPPDDPAQSHPRVVAGGHRLRRRAPAAGGEAARDRRVPRWLVAPPGTGVVIGHPDTGHTFHQALGQFEFGPRREGAPPTRVHPRDGYGFRDCNCNTFDLS